jgi:Domain of unknown function (DUF1963)
MSDAADRILLKTLWPYNSQDLDSLSYIGGDPKLPPNFPWPTINVKGEELPLHFIAQFECSRLPDCTDRQQLPSNGILYFFAIMMDEAEKRTEDCWPARILHLITEPSRLQARKPPAVLADIHPLTAHRAPWLRNAISIEDSSNQAKRFGFCPIDPVPIEGPECEPGYTEELEEELDNLFGAMSADLIDPGPLTDDKHWPETALQAIDMLRRWQPHVYQEEQLARIDSGVSWDDPHLNKNIIWAKGDRTARLELIAKWRTEVEERNKALALVKAALDELETYSPLASPSDDLRLTVRSLSETLGVGSWPSEDITFSILKTLPADQVPLSNTSIALARYRSYNSIIPGTNYHHILGAPLTHTELDLALLNFRRFEILDESSTIDDIRLVLVLSSSMAFGACFGDVDRLHFFVPRYDFENGCFDRAIALISGT